MRNALIMIMFMIAAAPASAAGIDFSHVLVDETGNPAKDLFSQKKDDQECDRCPVLTLGLAAAHALMMQMPDERDLDPLQKWARGALAMRLHNDKEDSLLAEEIATIKKQIGKVYGPVIIMQAFPLLDPSEKPPVVK